MKISLHINLATLSTKQNTFFFDCIINDHFSTTSLTKMINKLHNETISSHPPDFAHTSWIWLAEEKRDLRARPAYFHYFVSEYYDIYRALIEAICCKFNLAFPHLSNTYRQLLVIAFWEKLARSLFRCGQFSK